MSGSTLPWSTFKYDSVTRPPMATLDWQLGRTGEVTLVELSVRSDRDQQVCIESRLRPVWPPRRRGVPVRGWREDTFEGTVERGQPLVVGYATPAPPSEPPAEITETGSPPDDSITPRRLVRTLGDSRPPRDALPRRRPDDTDGGTADTPDGTTAETVDPGGADETATGTSSTSADNRGSMAARPRTADQPVESTAWFEAVESRLDTTETLAGATDADEIRAAVDAAGGIDSVRALQAQLDADRRQLREVRRRSETLSDRLSSVELPLATLERVV